jgi:hypothetical protein
MNPKTTPGQQIDALARRFPPGTIVWHRASAVRAVVVGYRANCQNTTLEVDNGGQAFDYWTELVASRTKVEADRDEGDDWKEESVEA